MDSATDALVQETVRSSFPNSMLLIIAHRLQTIADCTRIAIMSEGVLAEIGAQQAREKSTSLCVRSLACGADR